MKAGKSEAMQGAPPSDRKRQDNKQWHDENA